MIPVRRLVIILLVIPMTACATGADDQASSDAAASSPPAATTEAARSPQPNASPSSLEPSEGFETAEITLSSGNEQIPMSVWVAADEASRQRGLMGRESIPSDAGMLFVFETPTIGGFWMKNTLIPLSIAFIDEDGQVLQILDMQPCTADPCEIYTPDPAGPYLYALEANLGYFDDQGIRAGWSVELDDALRGTQ
jgi:uncharacterized membrane protein (UPF0127 family)